MYVSFNNNNNNNKIMSHSHGLPLLNSASCPAEDINACPPRPKAQASKGVKVRACPPKKIDRCERERRENARMQFKWLLCWLGYTFAELFGSLVLVFLAAGATDHILLGGGVAPSAQVVGVYFAVVLFPLIFTLSQFKSGDFNPAISLGVYLNSLFENGWDLKPFVVLISKLVAQFLGALIGAWLLSWFTTAAAAGANSVTALGALAVGRAIFLEILGTAAIVLFAILGKGGIALKSLSMAVLIGALVSLAAPLSGGSFNFFRTLGPAIVQGTYVNVASVYLVGFLGGVAVALILKFIFFDAQRYIRRTSSKTHSE